MPTRKQRTWIAAARAVVVVLVGVVVWHYAWGRCVRVVEGTVTFVDAAGHRASLECEDPKSGTAIELSSELPPDRAITIYGEPATPPDVRVGDHGRVKGQVKLGPICQAPSAKNASSRVGCIGACPSAARCNTSKGRLPPQHQPGAVRKQACRAGVLPRHANAR